MNVHGIVAVSRAKSLKWNMLGTRIRAVACSVHAEWLAVIKPRMWYQHQPAMLLLLGDFCREMKAADGSVLTLTKADEAAEVAAADVEYKKAAAAPSGPAVSLAARPDILEQAGFSQNAEMAYARQVELNNGRWVHAKLVVQHQCLCDFPFCARAFVCEGGKSKRTVACFVCSLRTSPAADRQQYCHVPDRFLTCKRRGCFPVPGTATHSPLDCAW